jgi:hypothetical protein
MSKDRRSHGRRPRVGEADKRQTRRQARRQAWEQTNDGAGSRDPAVPKRHHRQPKRG